MSRTSNEPEVFKGEYILKGIPPDLWSRAREMAAEHRPPLSMRWVLIQLLEKWIASAPPGSAITPQPPAAAKPKNPDNIARMAKVRAARGKKNPPPVVRDPPKAGRNLPDLGSSF